jgi:hypothetical protein
MERNPWMNSLERMDEEVRKENESLDTYIAQQLTKYLLQLDPSPSLEIKLFFRMLYMWYHCLSAKQHGPTFLIFRIFAAFLKFWVIYGNFYQFLW